MKARFEGLADGLAEFGYAVMDGFLDDAEVRAILDLDVFKGGIGSLKKAGIGNHQNLQLNEAIRGDYIQWLDKSAAPLPLKVYLKRLQDLRGFLNRNLFLSLQDEEVHLTVYPVGSFYKRHLDQFKKDDRRKLSAVCYLNTNWDEAHGGQLRMYCKDGKIDILPFGGRMVCFRSDQIEHEVLPAKRERLSLTGWMLDLMLT
ncbi:MAG: 2OG-Fe(II) oxygenase [Cyclobacteriaceae bacterium]|nr:2OG-Fe(II) oxygenase [Cyclobacteriaceae bacterium]MDH4296194.1 2OG-Fe(II) oxygenase [Cyclobacteriaceae bacterium]